MIKFKTTLKELEKSDNLYIRKILGGFKKYVKDFPEDAELLTTEVTVVVKEKSGLLGYGAVSVMSDYKEIEVGSYVDKSELFDKLLIDLKVLKGMGFLIEYMNKREYLAVQVTHGDQEFVDALKEFVKQYGRKRLGGTNE